jgi:hypothetical protein
MMCYLSSDFVFPLNLVVKGTYCTHKKSGHTVSNVISACLRPKLRTATPLNIAHCPFKSCNTSTLRPVKSGPHLAGVKLFPQRAHFFLCLAAGPSGPLPQRLEKTREKGLSKLSSAGHTYSTAGVSK